MVTAQILCPFGCSEVTTSLPLLLAFPAVQPFLPQSKIWDEPFCLKSCPVWLCQQMHLQLLIFLSWHWITPCLIFSSSNLQVIICKCVPSQMTCFAVLTPQDYLRVVQVSSWLTVLEQSCPCEYRFALLDWNSCTETQQLMWRQGLKLLYGPSY